MRTDESHVRRVTWTQARGKHSIARRPHVSSVKLAADKEIEERLATPLLY